MNDEYYENEYNEEENGQRRGYSISDSARNLKSNIDNVRDISNRLKNRSNDSVNHKEASDISNRINNTRNQSLINNNVNPNDINGLSTNGIANEGLTPKATLGNGANALNEIDAAKNAGELASGAGKALETAKGASDAVKAGSTIASGTGATVGGTAATAGTAATTMGASAAAGGAGAATTAAAATGGFPVIAIVLIAAVVIIGLLLLVVFLSDFTNNNLGMKYGMSGTDTYNTFSQNYTIDGKSLTYYEGMSRSQIDQIYKTSKGETCAEVGWFTDLKNTFFGVYDLTDPTELCRYMNKTLKAKEEHYNIKTISPGYVLSTLYYAYDLQKYKEDGSSYFKYVEENDSEEVNISDMDVLTILFANKVYSAENVSTALDNYTLSSYNYYIYTPVPQTATAQDGTEETIATYECIAHTYNARVSKEKYQLYLRYGDQIASSYENDVNNNGAYDKSSEECRIEKGLTKVDVSKYDNVYDFDKDELVRIDGKGYTDGFIFQTYPRYSVNGLNGTRANYSEEDMHSIYREIETIIAIIESRQDYTNYVLGYPSDISRSSLRTSTCSYNLDGINTSKLMVKLTHAKYNDALPGIEPWADIEGQELIDFEKYIMGVVYAENGNGHYESYKAQAVAARTYILANLNSRFHTYQDGENTVIVISNSTYDQTYCDPDLGCERFLSSNCFDGTPDSCNVTLLTVGTVPSGYTPNANGSNPLTEDSEIRKAVNEVAGQYLIDSNGKIASIGYGQTQQNSWNNDTGDYIEMLRKTYPDASVNMSSCTEHINGILSEQEKQEYITEMLRQYPNISQTRINIISTALDGVGLPYFWGGGHGSVENMIDIAQNKWGKETCVISDNSYGKAGVRTLCGFDCSGFVRWSIYNATQIDLMSGGGYVFEHEFVSGEISSEELTPGDIGYRPSVGQYGTDSWKTGHVGIFLYKNENGENVFVHATGGKLGTEVSTGGNLHRFFHLSIN